MFAVNIFSQNVRSVVEPVITVRLTEDNESVTLRDRVPTEWTRDVENTDTYRCESCQSRALREGAPEDYEVSARQFIELVESLLKLSFYSVRRNTRTLADAISYSPSQSSRQERNFSGIWKTILIPSPCWVRQMRQLKNVINSHIVVLLQYNTFISPLRCD